MKVDIDKIEINLVLDAIYQRYGYDFRQYSEAHVKRRLTNRLALTGLKSISEMQHKVLHDEEFAGEILQDLSRSGFLYIVA